jgi:uracil-DNA glycosylase
MARLVKPEHLDTFIERLHTRHPNAKYELNWETPLQLLVATILAAQCTDERVNMVTVELFKKYPSAKAYADADLTQLGEDVKQTGFYQMKAEAVQGACKGLVERYHGEVPRTMDELLTLPRVGRKTANIVLNHAFNIPTGIIVDSHAARVCRRLGLSKAKKAEKIELELLQFVPKEYWISLGPAMVLHGRYTCTNLKPNCAECIMSDICPKIDVDEPKVRKARDKATAPTATRAGAAAAVSFMKGATTAMKVDLPPSWQTVLAEEFNKPYFKELEKFVDAERKAHQVFPPEEDVFNAFKAAPFDKVKVLLLGQDPYHDDGQAHGMCFSVRPGVKPPPSLVNMFKELKTDLGCTIPNHGFLEEWANQGILLLNAVLTVRAHQANSHKDRGWEQFTDAVIKALNARDKPLVFVLWGGYAQKKEKLIDAKKHRVLKAAHPSPLSASKFFGCKPFSAVNAALKQLGQSEINWQLANL